MARTARVHAAAEYEARYYPQAAVA